MVEESKERTKTINSLIERCEKSSTENKTNKQLLFEKISIAKHQYSGHNILKDLSEIIETYSDRDNSTPIRFLPEFEILSNSFITKNNTEIQNNNEHQNGL